MTGTIRALGVALHAALLLVSLAAAPGARALEIKAVEGGNDKVTTVSLSGRVDVGDGLKVRAFFGTLPAGKPIVAQLQLDGGDRNQAMSIGRYFHQARVRTVVPPNGARCGSPCPLVLVGGRDPETGRPAYVKHSSGIVQFNGPLLNYADKEYKVGDLDGIVAAAQRDTLAIADYLKAVGANIGILKHYVSVGVGATPRVLADEEALDLGIAVHDDRSNMLIPATKGR